MSLSGAREPVSTGSEEGEAALQRRRRIGAGAGAGASAGAGAGGGAGAALCPSGVSIFANAAWEIGLRMLQVSED